MTSVIKIEQSFFKFRYKRQTVFYVDKYSIV